LHFNNLFEKDMTYDIPIMVSEATGVLKSLIAIPSLSRDKEKAADYRQNYIELQGMVIGRKGNNVRYLSPMFDLNKPNESYSN
jgi:acetylornithine deacetylase